tara:strand:- start:51 stop:2705 length:2655 start_codon:yes stop_codon:yes gene_type:complete
MGIFRNIKRSLTACHDIDEKIEYLNKELEKTGLHEMMTTPNMYQQGTKVPNQDSIDFQGLSLNGYPIGLSASDGNHLGGAGVDSNGVALSPPDPVTAARTSARHIRNGTGDSIPLRPGETTTRGDGNNAPTITMGSAVWFYHPETGTWNNAEFFTAPGQDGALGYWDTNNQGFWIHNTTGSHPRGDILSLTSGINFGANGVIGPPQTIVLQKNDLSDVDFLPINIPELSKQGFDYLTGKAQDLLDKVAKKLYARSPGQMPWSYLDAWARDYWRKQASQSSDFKDGVVSFGRNIINRASKALGDFLKFGLGGSDWMIKGIRGASFSNFKFDKDLFTNFKGGGPNVTDPKWIDRQFGKIFKGRKLSDFVDDLVSGATGGKWNPKFFQKLAGKNYVGQYFTDGQKFQQAIDYAQDGVAVATERLNSASGWKNWFGGSVSRSVIGEPEIYVRGSDLAKNKTFKVFDTSTEAGRQALQNLASKTTKSSQALRVAGRAVPFVGAVASAYDAYDRFERGDTMGGVLSVASMMPGVVGWWALGAQVAYDIEGAAGPFKFKQSVKSQDDGLKKAARFVRGEEYIMEGVDSDTQVIPDIAKQGMYDYLMEQGVPLNDPEQYSKEMIAALSLEDVNPELIQMILVAINRKEYDKDDIEDIKRSMTELSINLIAHRKKMMKGKDSDKKQVKESYITEGVGLGHFDPEVLTVDINDIRKGIMPEFPKDPPPEMVGGYAANSRLAPKTVERDPFIKITKKDLAKNHKLKDSEIKEFMDQINAINNFIKKHPEELIYAQTRYPKNDPRLAQLNWEMDQRLNASKEYMDKHYPENQKLFTKIQKTIKKNIELTDPKSFKGVKIPKFEGVDLTDHKRRKEVVSKHYKKAIKIKKLFSKKKT